MQTLYVIQFLQYFVIWWSNPYHIDDDDGGDNDDDDANRVVAWLYSERNTYSFRSERRKQSRTNTHQHNFGYKFAVTEGNAMLVSGVTRPGRNAPIVPFS